MGEIAAPAELVLKPGDFRRLGQFISDYSGIKITPSKRAMVEGRLRRRVLGLGFGSFAEYCRYVFEEGGLDQEGVAIIDAVTTNKTDFFREPEHFRLLVEQVLPALAPAGRPRTIKVWSAACSTGAEPYTLAMLLSEYATRHAGFDYQVLATDLCTEVLETARLGIYHEDDVRPVPRALRQRYLLRSCDRPRRQVRISPDIRSKVRFGRLNLMDGAYGVEDGLDAVFCRNVLIYFDKPTQSAVLARLCDHLAPGGTLFIGHAETLAGFNLPLKQIAPTVFLKE